MLNLFLQSVRSIIDLPLRIRNKSIRILKRIKPFSDSDCQSDSENTFYLGEVIKINSSDRKFRKFRRIYNYREILEHVSPKFGKLYLDILKKDHESSLTYFKEILYLDKVGKPYRYFYKELGLVSPTSIRYAYVAQVLSYYFPKQITGKIAEIGVGFGGQAALLLRTNDIAKYTMFDLPEVLNLVVRYLAELDLHQKIDISDVNVLRDESWDLVISNYAFSELPRNLQIDYIKKVLIKSKSGFMIMNSGRTDLTGRSSGKMTVNEIISYIPSATVLDENPKTSKDNYIIIWGSTK